MTFSIVARSEDGLYWGVAAASKFLAVGSRVPAAIAGIGAVATQADANVAYKSIALGLLDEGMDAAEALAELVLADTGRDQRQVGIVDAAGNSASHTGASCLPWAGGRTGPGYAIQGNVLVGEAVVTAVEKEWLAGDPSAPLGRRLVRALAAGDAAGGDRRGRQSAVVLVVSQGAGYGGGDDIAVDLRVDDHTDPVGELARLLALNDLFLTASTKTEKVIVTPGLAEELHQLVRACGHDNLGSWVGTENFEMRVAADGSWIDEKVLSILRQSAR